MQMSSTCHFILFFFHPFPGLTCFVAGGLNPNVCTHKGEEKKGSSLCTVGLGRECSARDDSICAHTILQEQAYRYDIIY